MGTYRSIEEYRRAQDRRIAKLRAGKRRGPITSAKFMAAKLRVMCPRGTYSHPGYPMMYQTIKRNKNRVSLGGTNPNTGFPYVHWINDTPGVDRTTHGMKYIEVENQHGQPGFYWIALDMSRKFNREAMLSVTRKALSSEF